MTKQENYKDKLREIVHLNWERGDEVGLFEQALSLHLQELSKIVEWAREADEKGAGGKIYEVPAETPYSAPLADGKWYIHEVNKPDWIKSEGISVTYHGPTRDLLNRLLAITDES